MWLLLALACSPDDATGTKEGPPSSSTPPGTSPPTTSSPPTAPVAPPTLTVESSDTQLLALDVTITLAAAGPTWAACTRDDLSEEVLLLEGEGVTGEQTWVLLGATTDARYSCEVHGPGGQATDTVTTPALPEALLGYEVTTAAPPNAEPFLTLFADMRACSSVLTSQQSHVVMVDHEGAPRWLLPVPEPIPSIDLDVSFLQPEGLVHIGGGWGTTDASIPHQGLFRTVELDGSEVYERTVPAIGLGFNHHSERLDDGSFLTLSFEEISDGGDRQLGVAIEQWDPTTDELTWSWSSQQLVDRDQLHFADTPDLGSWTANSLSLAADPLGTGLYLSVVTIDEIWRLDPDTGDLTHRIGPHGDWALFDVDGQALESRDWFYFQHDPEISADGRLLLHDNGTTRGLFPDSRVLELQLDFDAREAQVLWEWTEPGWYNSFVGDADRLPDGHVAVTQGYFSCFSGRDGHSSVVEVDPATDEVVWRLDWSDPDFAPYRSERLALCDVLPNSRHCPEVAERLAALRGEAR